MAETKKTTAKKKEEEVVMADDTNELVEVEEFEYDLADFDQFDLGNLSGIEAINASDIRVPYGKMYSKAQDGRKVGDIELPDGTVYEMGETLEGLSILKIQPVRVFFPTPFKPTNTFICRSLDGKVGAEDGKYPGQACASCEFAQYPEGGGASPCREQLLLLCTVPDGTLFYLLVSGIGVREFKNNFMSVEMMNGFRIVKSKLKNNILAALNLNVITQNEDTDYGPFPVLVFKVNKKKPLVEPARLKQNLEAYSSYKEFEQEAVATAATFAQTEQGEHDPEESQAAEGENSEMF